MVLRRFIVLLEGLLDSAMRGSTWISTMQQAC